ncbi:GPI ethanolamine phosphate transferase 2-like [Paramacrobiotus metropolitanus]|uniref:GPI ethanolamine phosphate transferase 2-like n=1 Tax=Paramacrobiotus metropolitanus TaxID=2943436 RepID=UPI002446168E|nr:GPI ethanolamine phosphate transferase 2-like [Paramacrobiotus metropolitanus]
MRTLITLIGLHIASVLLFLSGFFSVSLLDTIQHDRETPHSPPPPLSRLQQSEISTTLCPGCYEDVQQQPGVPGSSGPEKNISKPFVDKLVLILIDALRADFVFTVKYEGSFGFVAEQMRNGKALGFIANARTPTVTLPRIKALTTGVVPDFSDVIVNFGASRLLTDSVVRQWALGGRRMVFYGDDTWMKLFPDTFLRSEGVSSFFVNDYTEVDNNVTRNIEKELLRSDWDVTIVHLLGLDHIGHLAGPHSSLVDPKLREMDRVVRKMYRFIENQSGNGLVVLFGDHGMTDTGSHGGSSATETETAMVFLSPAFRNANPPSVASIAQVDLASTVSILMGTAIPRENTGRPILPVLKQFLPVDALQTALCDLYAQLSVRRMIRDEEKHRDVFGLCTRNVSHIDVDTFDKILATETREESKAYNVISMGCAVIILLLVTACHLKAALRSRMKGENRGQRWMMAVLVFHASSFLSSSFIEEEHQMWYYWVSTVYLMLLWRCLTEKKTKGMCYVLGLMVIQRVLREWNRTGDKWAGLPDVGDWLREPDHNFSLNAVVGLSILSQLVLVYITGNARRSVPGIIAAGLYQIFGLNWAAWIVYGNLFVTVLFGKRTNPRRADICQFGLLCLITILVRPHNVVLVTGLMVKERFIRIVLKDLEIPNRLICLIYHSEAWCSWFALGNSNSISTIDVSAGFVGINFYFAPLHAVLILLHTYCGPIFWLLSFCCFFSLNKQPRICDWKTVHLGLGIRSCFGLMAFLSCTVQRYHLFVWTVFAPKILYESVHSVAFCFCMIGALLLKI